jgi:hypothetical protein
MKIIICLIALVFCTSLCIAQNNAKPSEAFSIEGRIKHSWNISIAALDSFKTNSLPDVIVTNHLGEKKNTLTSLKGVLLKDILAKLELDAENPKVLSQYYFVFTATDNYKIVFSWNEIFNTETGNNIYIITEEGGHKIADLKGRISIVTLTDFKTGRRHLSNLEKISVEHVQ